MAERFFFIITADVTTCPDFQTALEKAKRFAKTNEKPFAVCEAICVVHPDGMTEILEKPRPTGEGDQ